IAGLWGGTGGDTFSYLTPIDNLLAKGNYLPDFRMPGYGTAYLIFKLFFSTATACNILIVLQYLLASASVYFLALTTKNIFNSTRIFYFSFYIFLICNFPNFFDGYILTESLCTSFLIFSVYFFTNYFTSKKIVHLFLSSVFISWAIFIRPGFSLLLPVFALGLVFQKRSGIKSNLKYGLIFLVPFIIVDSAWTIRNYHHYKKIVPLTAISNYPDVASTYLGPLFYFVQGWGGAYSLRDKEPDISWFEYTYPGRIKPTHYDSLPDYIYTSKYNKDSLLHLKKLIIALQNPMIDRTTAAAYQRELMFKFNKYREALQEEKPFLYYVRTPLKLTAIFLYGAYTKKYLDRGQTLGRFNILLRAFANTLYLTTLILGIIGMLFLLFKGYRHNILFILIALIPLYTIVLHAIVLRIPDTRFFMPTWPFLIICEAYALSVLSDKLYGNSQKLHKP
ncbi:MAG TPA: hypothetical protein VK808_07725, partial [Bacteroidia bacterium]|nr:hypothetical protein [Bacteroidia bacterium]